MLNLSQSKDDKADQPISQQKRGWRQGWPDWMRQLPRWNFPPPDEDFQLLDLKALEEVLKDQDPESVQRIREDIAFLDKELLRLFRERDYEASFEQNRYRLYQIMYMILAAIATLIGSILSLALTAAPSTVPFLAFAETIVALLTTYLATISGRESPLPRWLANRRKAEHLRREYFRYLMVLSPYDTVTGYNRERMLSVRAADINRGFYPEIENTEV